MILRLIICLIAILIAWFLFVPATKPPPSLTGGNLFIPRKFPAVGIVTNELLRNINLKDFVWLDKTDGMRSVLIFNDKDVFVVKRGEAVPLATVSTPFSGESIIDTELYDGVYYAYDCAMIDGADVAKEGYIERMKKIDTFIHQHQLPITIRLKSYHPIENISKLVKYINKYQYSPETGHRIDGVIIQRCNSEYWDMSSYKLKKKVMNTTDFKLIYDNGCFYMYLVGRKIDLVWNMRKLPKVNKHSMKHVGVDFSKMSKDDSFYILFESPFYNRLDRFTPREGWDKSGYDDESMREIEDLMSVALDHPEELNGKIVEMSLAEDGWVPMRIRDDKTFSNGYSIGVTNMEIVFNPVEGDVGEKVKREGFDVGVAVGEGGRLSVVEFGAGCEEELIKRGMMNCFVIDNDKDALVDAVHRVKESKERCYVNAICGDLCDETIDELKMRFEFPRDGVDVVVMNEAMKRPKNGLADLAKNLLKDGGLFVVKGDVGNADVDMTVKEKKGDVTVMVK